ncbi:MAG: hypothetical protein ACRD21_28305, partial [Vicinamibacteria bacterium]
GLRRAGVSVYGVDERFFRFHEATDPGLEGRKVLLTEGLRGELGSEDGDTILLRVERPSEVSRSSLYGTKEDVGRTLRLEARSGLAETGLPEFSIVPQQESVLAVFVPLARLQRDLEEEDRVNTILLHGLGHDVLVEALRKGASLDDLSLRIRVLEPPGVLSVESDALMLADPVLEAVDSTAAQLYFSQHRFFTYLANELSIGEKEIPYSLVTGVDEDVYPGSGVPDGIVLNEWAGEDLGARPGDALEMEFYVWEDEGRIATRSARFTVEAIVPMEGIASDRDLAPSYPGISETESLSDWEPPFPIDLERVRDKDEDYWDRFRTTPKAFVPLARGQELWQVRQGKLTSIRLTPEAGTDLDSAQADVERELRSSLDPMDLG